MIRFIGDVTTISVNSIYDLNLTNDTITKVNFSNAMHTQRKKRTRNATDKKSVEGHTAQLSEIKLKNIQHYWITWYLHFMTNSINQSYISHIFTWIFSCLLFSLLFWLSFDFNQFIIHLFVNICATWEFAHVHVCVAPEHVSANEHLVWWKYSMEQRSDIIMSPARQQQQLMGKRNFLSKIFRSLMSVKVTFVC